MVRVKKESRINQNRVWNKERVTFFLCQPLVGLPMPGGAPPIELLTVARSRMVSISACMKAHGFWEPWEKKVWRIALDVGRILTELIDKSSCTNTFQLYVLFELVRFNLPIWHSADQRDRRLLDSGSPTAHGEWSFGNRESRTWKWTLCVDLTVYFLFKRNHSKSSFSRAKQTDPYFGASSSINWNRIIKILKRIQMI